MVTIKLPALSPGWEPISPTLIAEIGSAVDHEPASEDAQSWPWAGPGLDTVMGDIEGAPGSEHVNWADLDVGSPGIEIRSESASAPLEFESLSLRASHGGIRLMNVAWLTSADGASAVVAQALAGAIVVDGLSAAADAATAASVRGRLSFWAKVGDARVSRVRVSVS